MMFSVFESFKEVINGGFLFVNNLEIFFIGLLEFKVVWVDVDVIVVLEVVNYYIISVVIEVDGVYVIKIVVLLGMYVVGVVINYLEFIWVIFEYYSMVFIYNWVINEVSVSNDMFLFVVGIINILVGIQWDGSVFKEVSKVYIFFELGVFCVFGNGFMVIS